MEDARLWRVRQMGSAEGQRAAGIPTQYHGAVFADFPSLQNELEGYYKAERCGLLSIIGPCGLGKTRVAYAFRRRCFEDERFCELHYAPALLGRLAKARQYEEADRLGRVAGLLILDDAFAESPTPEHLRFLTLLVHAREEWGLAMLVTMNLDLGRVAEVCERTASRLSGGLVLELAGEDRRLARWKR